MSFHQDYEEADGIERALYAIAIALDNCAYQLKYLGNGSASTQMGAIEHLSVQIKEGLSEVAGELNALGFHVSGIGSAKD